MAVNLKEKYGFNERFNMIYIGFLERLLKCDYKNNIVFNVGYIEAIENKILANGKADFIFYNLKDESIFSHREIIESIKEIIQVVIDDGIVFESTVENSTDRLDELNISIVVKAKFESEKYRLTLSYWVNSFVPTSRSFNKSVLKLKS